MRAFYYLRGLNDADYILSRKKGTCPWRCAQISFSNEWKRQYKNVVQCVREEWEFTSLIYTNSLLTQLQISQNCLSRKCAPFSPLPSTSLHIDYLKSVVLGLQKQRCPEKLNFSEIIYNAFAVVYECFMQAINYYVKM